MKVNKLNSLLFAISSLLLCSSSQADSTHFAKQLNELTDKQLPNATVGLIIQDPKSGKVLFAQRSKENFHPASNTKLFTASAALTFFGPDFQFQTSLHTHLDKLEQGTLNDNVYLVFRGDPAFTTKDLNTLINQLKEKGINQIHGNFIIDDAAFEGPVYGSGWTWESLPWGYSAPVTAIIFNENKVQLKLNKPNALHDPISIQQTDNTLPPFPLQTNVIAATLEETEKNCPLNAYVKNNRIQLSGCWPIDRTPSFIEVAIDDPRSLAKMQVEHALTKSNIRLVGQVTFGKTPKQVPSAFTQYSPPLKEILVKVLADSNNIYADSLTKSLGIAYLGRGTFQAGATAIQEILKKEAGLEFLQTRLNDGSGLSRYNLVSPYLISQLLYHMYHNRSFPDFYAALSKNGQTGTLKNRLQDEKIIGKVSAKTGTLTGTSTLSGYFTAKSGKEYLFSLMINQSAKNAYALKAFEDKLCLMLMEEPWLKTKPLSNTNT